MLIPVEVEKAEDFIARVRAALDDPDVHVYVDTSLLMWLTAVGPSSRAVFIDWASTMAGRIHVPTWSAHEYYRHHQRKTQVVEIAEKCAVVDKALKDLKSHMRIYADGPLVPEKAEMSFVTDLEDAAGYVEDAMKVALGWNYDAAASEVIGWINAHVLEKTGVFDGLASLRRRGSVRYGHEVPPGFEDGHKGLNRFGDLIFWEDVMADARTRPATTAVVLTRDRKKDWFFSGLETETSEELRRLKGKWNPVPVAHPMLTLEMRTIANAQLILLDELYMGGVMWLTDKQRFGRLAAVTFGMDLARLESATRGPPGVVERAARRDAIDNLGLSEALGIIKASRADDASAAVLDILASLEGQAPAVHGAIERLTLADIGAMDVSDLAVLSRRLYDGARDGPSAAATLARRLLDTIDRVDAAHASAIIGGMLVAAYFENDTPRPAPVGQLLQEVLEWRVDSGVERTVSAMARQLRSVHSPALYYPSTSTDLVEVRIEASESVMTTPVAVGQIFIGSQGILVDSPIEPDLVLSKMLAGADRTTVSKLVSMVATHHGIPLAILGVIDAKGDEERTILSNTGMDRFDPLRQPRRAGDEARLPGPTSRASMAAAKVANLATARVPSDDREQDKVTRAVEAQVDDDYFDDDDLLIDEEDQ